ncbi:hypothetical protein CCACVL1_16094 [Corchorus capsularis]|uniref:Uncharacterized protein n=1 Tax=Corchorus capsularis TaxID=210143 RepID=A0A1R3HZJ4_COCAP|nr:hypothetical protein CCACVL1_16094 [Corchorus capsularis]
MGRQQSKLQVQSPNQIKVSL